MSDEYPAKAQLVRLKDGPPVGKTNAPSAVPDETIEVQFNPTSLKIQRSNNIDKGGATTNTQRRHYSSPAPATLSFELEFDTAEGQGDGGRALDVRGLTALVRQFVEPLKKSTSGASGAAPSSSKAGKPSLPGKDGAPPPRVAFHWGSIVFPGIVTQLTEDLDYFAADGTPLRARLSLTITEQDLDYEAGKTGPAARDNGATAPPGGKPAGTAPGSSGTTNPTQTTLAQSGESVQQLLSRLDADPATWRSAMNGLDSPLALAAGAEVQLGAAVSVSAGLGISARFAVGADVSATASLAGALGVGASAGVGAAPSFSAGASAALSADASVSVSAVASAGFSADASAGFSGASAGVSAEAVAGFALSAGGGVSASLDAVQSAVAGAAVGQARASFAVPATTAVASARVDPRALGYGRSIPLRARADAGQRASDVASATIRWTPGR